jgi:hypothetical protein
MAITRLMREMAMAVLINEDEAAALALADLLHETTTRQGVPLHSIKHFTTADISRLRAVLYLNCHISQLEMQHILRVQSDIAGWLRGDNHILVWGDIVKSMEVYELPSLAEPGD